MRNNLIKLLLVFSLAFTITNSNATNRSRDLSKLKTAFIFNFTKYIKWRQKPHPSFIISVIGDPVLTEKLKSLANKKKFKKSISIEVYQKKSSDNLNNSHLIYIATEDVVLVKSIIERLKSKSILTIGHGKDLTNSGIIINFYLHNKKLKFEINNKKATSIGLNFSSQLLKLGKLVN